MTMQVRLGNRWGKMKGIRVTDEGKWTIPGGRLKEMKVLAEKIH